MAETLCELVVALSLNSILFSGNIRTINQQVRIVGASFTASEGMGCPAGTGKKKPRQRFIDEVWSGIKP